MAESYLEYAELSKLIAHNMAEDLDLFALKPKCILEIGCGPGNLTQLLQKKFPNAQIIGIDIAEKMCYQAVKLNSNASKGKKTNFVTAVSHNLPLKDNSVDIVISNLFFQWLENLPQTLKECNRVLKKNALLFCSSLGANTLGELRSTLETISCASYLNNFLDLHHLGDALVENSFCQPVIHQENIKIVYNKLVDLRLDLKNTGSNILLDSSAPALSKSKYQALFSLLKSLFEQDSTSLSFEIVYAHAWKGLEVFKGPNRDRTNLVEISLDQLKAKPSGKNRFN